MKPASKEKAPFSPPNFPPMSEMWEKFLESLKLLYPQYATEPPFVLPAVHILSQSPCDRQLLDY